MGRGGGGCKEKPPPTFPLPEIHITALLVYVRVVWLAHGDVPTTNNSLLSPTYKTTPYRNNSKKKKKIW